MLGWRQLKPFRSILSFTIMKKIMLLLILVAIGWKGYEKYSHSSNRIKASSEHAVSTETELENVPDNDVRSSFQPTFTCDGRVYCSQMKSCEEATYFLEHCPNVKMDGNHDGVPCEKQWCSK